MKSAVTHAKPCGIAAVIKDTTPSTKGSTMFYGSSSDLIANTMPSARAIDTATTFRTVK
ncbi:MAG TPA: hypothetical protein VEZ72_15465 [Paenibacillus sp.]|nr:hypothetical protein [Paenibacillus sp.]